MEHRSIAFNPATPPLQHSSTSIFRAGGDRRWHLTICANGSTISRKERISSASRHVSIGTKRSARSPERLPAGSGRLCCSRPSRITSGVSAADCSLTAPAPASECAALSACLKRLPTAIWSRSSKSASLAACQADHRRQGADQRKYDRRGGCRFISVPRSEMEPAGRRPLSHDFGYGSHARSRHRRAQWRHLPRYDHRQEHDRCFASACRWKTAIR